MNLDRSKITIKFKCFLNQPGYLRQIGERIRNEIIDAWTIYETVELDFEGETVASGSLFDEIDKLFNDFPKEEVKCRLRFVNIDPWDERLIVYLTKLRMAQKKKAS